MKMNDPETRFNFLSFLPLNNRNIHLVPLLSLRATMASCHIPHRQGNNESHHRKSERKKLANAFLLNTQTHTHT